VLTWRKSGFITRLDEDHLYADKRSAIAAIVPKLDGDICAGCRARVFDECAGQPRPVLAPPPSSPGSA
jgi:SulP family sulfate permease